MKELGITKGEWFIEKKFDYKHQQDVYAIGSKFDEEVLNEEFATIWTWMIEDEAVANAKLIADAGTTANKCNILPSELLERYNEAIEVLKAIKQSCDEGKIELMIGQYSGIKQTISKSK